MPITLHRHQFPPYHRRHHHRCNNPWKLQWYLGVPSASSCIAETHQTRCMSLRTCTCKWPARPRTRTYQIILWPPSHQLLFWLQTLHTAHTFAARAGESLTRSATATVSLRVLYMRTRARHRVDTRGTHLDGGSPVCRARPCRHFHASVADAVYLAIGPGFYQGFKLLPQHGRYEQTALGTHFNAQREPT